MGLLEAIKICFGKYATFEGRARRSEYWYWFLFSVILGLIFGLIPVLGWIVSLALFLPSVAVGVRRLHDTGKSGWLYLLNLIPVIGSIVLLVFYAQDSQPGANQYGENPKGM